MRVSGLARRVGLNVAKLRQERGLTQEELAGKAKITQGYVSMLEEGVRDPSVVMIEKLANALGVSYVDLLKERKA